MPILWEDIVSLLKKYQRKPRIKRFRDWIGLISPLPNFSLALFLKDFEEIRVDSALSAF